MLAKAPVKARRDAQWNLAGASSVPGRTSRFRGVNALARGGPGHAALWHRGRFAATIALEVQATLQSQDDTNGIGVALDAGEIPQTGLVVRCRGRDVQCSIRRNAPERPSRPNRLFPCRCWLLHRGNVPRDCGWDSGSARQCVSPRIGRRLCDLMFCRVGQVSRNRPRHGRSSLRLPPRPARRHSECCRRSGWRRIDPVRSSRSATSSHATTRLQVGWPELMDAPSGG